ncbi:MAG: lysophospholipid acyltransferase family protein [Chitinophagaceae bacterium]|nr:lysophospholipid acyltransferase family protein [Chitinophagaceae bacterium]
MYYLLFLIFYLVSLLPLRVLFLVSDLLFLLLFYVLKYRIQVTMHNLQCSFPEKTETERRQIARKYYKNLCDSIVETVKLMSISKTQLDKRIQCNWEAFDLMTQQDRNGQAYMSHQFNWEWATVLCNWRAPRRFTGLYMPLSNTAFNRIYLYLRGRSGTRLIAVQDMQQEMARVQNEKILWGFIADQNPSDPKRVSWNDFLHRKTAFFKGPEFVARRYNNLVYFGEIVKIKRGYYEIKLKLAFDNPRDTKEGEITESYVQHLEQSIKRQPENWVWSHRRWKHQYAG